jgi:hypothetical protein
MKEEWSLFGVVSTVLIVGCCIGLSSCSRRDKQKTSFEAVPQGPSDIDVKKVSAASGIPFKIIKTEDIGFSPKQRFFWVLTKETPVVQKTEELASAIIKETINLKPQTYHGFTIHFIDEAGFAGTPENSKCFAKATYFPEGSIEKIGRVLIDEYKEYKLVCTFLNKFH